MENKQALTKNILETINSPADVKALSLDELKQGRARSWASPWAATKRITSAPM